MVSVDLELSNEVHQRLVEEAEASGLSLQQYLLQRLLPPTIGLDSNLATPSDATGEDFDDPLGNIQEAYQRSLQIVHQRMVEVQVELLAMQRQVVQRTLQSVSSIGLIHQHHFYIAFRTTAPGVMLSSTLKASHPETMTIVLEQQFSNLDVDDEGFSVNLWFGGVPQRLAIPFDALLAFFDPSTQFQLTFPSMADDEATDDAEATAESGEPTGDAAGQAAMAVPLADLAEAFVHAEPAAAQDAGDLGTTEDEEDLGDDAPLAEDDAGDSAFLEDEEGKGEDDEKAEEPPRTDNVLSFREFRKK